MRTSVGDEEASAKDEAVVIVGRKGQKETKEKKERKEKPLQKEGLKEEELWPQKKKKKEKPLRSVEEFRRYLC